MFKETELESKIEFAIRMSISEPNNLKYQKQLKELSEKYKKLTGAYYQRKETWVKE